MQLAEVLAGARRGAPGAIAALYGWFAGDLLRLTGRLLGSAAAAEDVIHDLFVGLPEHLARYDERGRFGAWLRATAIGMARMQLRRDTRRDAVLARDAGAAPIAHAAADPALTLDLEGAVNALPESLRAVFVLKQWEGYSHDEIASLLEISAGASRVRHARALQLLRTRLSL